MASETLKLFQRSKQEPAKTNLGLLIGRTIDEHVNHSAANVGLEDVMLVLGGLKNKQHAPGLAEGIRMDWPSEPRDDLGDCAADQRLDSRNRTRTRIVSIILAGRAGRRKQDQTEHHKP
jgi:hypothetical protein